ncbi:MAG: UvrD-helicase domain-containing protein [Candidatus Pacebacteria bacterium]|nr:UvrD-helicase domain-containing protein [Candidatus Paceibacterota bacterium]
MSARNLNAAQQEAVQHSAGPAMVLAGAGSGKTTVLTARVAWLLENNLAQPENILLVTFTNKAAQEIKLRVRAQTNQDLPLCGTFHSVCAKLLRQSGGRIGISPSFTIYDSDDQVAAIKQIYKQHHFDDKEFAPKSVHALISKSKNELLSPAEYEQTATSNFQKFAAKIYTLYVKKLKAAQALDFDDLLMRAVELFQKDQPTRERWQQQISHVLIDEYQDTNTAQYVLTKFLAAPQNNLFVVGDFSQSIYSWRGADYRNMLALKTDYPDLKEYRLEQNYRSPQSILDAATAVIAKNTQHPILALWSEKTSADKIVSYSAQTGESEAAYVVQALSEQLRRYPASELAILYRTNAQSRLFEEALLRAGISYRLVGGVKFYERKEIKDLLAYARIIVNPLDEVSQARAEKLGKRRLASLEAARSKLEKLSKEVPQEFLQQILKVTTYLGKYKPEVEEDSARLENVEELVAVASQFETVTQFLENIALVQDKQFADRDIEGQSNSVSLMSLHAAKGLEFAVVFLAGLEEELLPHSRSIFNPEELEEERRLCYVGMTRAKERLFLSCARSRYQYGVRSSRIPSRFLADIAQDLLEKIDDERRDSYQTTRTFPLADQRTLVVDEDMIEDMLSGKISIDAFIDS